MSISIRKINAILMMKFSSMIKNMSIMTAPIMAIAFVIIMKSIMPDEHTTLMNTSSFVLSFGLLFSIIMGGIMMGSYPLAEEKEKNTLRVLMTSSVNGAEFFIGSMLPSLLIITITNIIILPLSGFSFSKINIWMFLIITISTSIISLLIGYLIGILAKSQIQSGLLSMPIMLIMIILPMFSVLKETLAKISRWIYGGSITRYTHFLYAPKQSPWQLQDTFTIIIWFVIAFSLFIYAYKKRGLE